MALLGGIARAARGQSAAPRELTRLVAANRILANEGVVDAFGHVSVRDPGNAERFWLSRSRSPALVETDDLMEFSLDGAAIDARGRTPYGERMIHAAVYAARADVHSVVHNHAYAVLPFTITDEPLEVRRRLACGLRTCGARQAAEQRQRRARLEHAPPRAALRYWSTRFRNSHFLPLANPPSSRPMAA